VTTYCGGTTVPLLALGLLGLVGALAAEMHLAALAADCFPVITVVIARLLTTVFICFHLQLAQAAFTKQVLTYVALCQVVEIVGALAAEMHLAALAGKHRRFFA
jgi:hypothetical protein